MKNLIIINEPVYSFAVEEFVHVFKPFGLDPSSISPSYGLAENCTFVSTSWRSGGINGSFPTYKKLLPCARLDSLNEDIEILVVSEEKNDPLDDGMDGEIWISSPSNTIGYLGHFSMTGKELNARLKSSAGCGRFVRTGDRGVVVGVERYLYVTGPNSDIIKLPNKKEVHPLHYLETAAYLGYPQKLRGGCVAAFSVSHEIVTIVAEMQQNEKNIRILKKICEGIKKSVFEEEAAVRIDVVVLVKCGNVPKTTCGKIQRWLVRENLMKGKMDVLMKMKFEYQSPDFVGFKTLNINGYKEKCVIEETKNMSMVIPAENNCTMWLSSL